MTRLPIFAACILVTSYGTTLADEPDEPKEAKPLEASDISALKFRPIGPALMSGRIADIAVDPEKPNTWYVAVGSGNLWKTENAGTTWTSIFDNYASYSIGCVTIDPQNRHTIWVGTGENVSGRHVGYGDGVYVSHDGGKTFNNLGLKESEHISKILVDPRDSRTVYVAAQGPLSQVPEKSGIFDFTGQVHLVTIANDRRLVLIFGTRRGVRGGKGQGPGQPFRGRGVNAEQVNQFKPVGRLVRRHAAEGFDGWRGRVGSVG